MSFKTNYRGYEIQAVRLDEGAMFEISQNGEVIDQGADTLAHAKMTIDGWVDAR